MVPVPVPSGLTSNGLFWLPVMEESLQEVGFPGTQILRQVWKCARLLTQHTGGRNSAEAELSRGVPSECDANQSTEAPPASQGVPIQRLLLSSIRVSCFRTSEAGGNPGRRCLVISILLIQ